MPTWKHLDLNYFSECTCVFHNHVRNPIWNYGVNIRTKVVGERVENQEQCDKGLSSSFIYLSTINAA